MVTYYFRGNQTHEPMIYNLALTPLHRTASAQWLRITDLVNKILSAKMYFRFIFILWKLQWEFSLLLMLCRWWNGKSIWFSRLTKVNKYFIHNVKFTSKNSSKTREKPMLVDNRRYRFYHHGLLSRKFITSNFWHSVLFGFFENVQIFHS